MKNRKETEKKKKKVGERPVRRTMIGGQALMEGVLMRGKSAVAMAVRTPDGEIALQTKRLKTKGGWYKKVPIVRGVVSFVVSLVSGMSALMKSAQVSGEEDETPGGGAMAIAAVLGVLLAVGLFIVLPWGVTALINRFVELGALFYGLIEGGIRIVIFILYLLLVSRMKDIRRTFMYHGAEHRTINCYEKGLEMTVENVQKCSTKHNRCGTTFLFFVVVISILVFALTNWLLSLTGVAAFENAFVKLGVRLLLLPIVAGLSYELLRFFAILPDNWFTNALRAPGLALQRLTTYPPDDDMARVALESFLAVLKMDEDESVKEVEFFERDFHEVQREFKDRLKAAGKNEKDFDFILADVLGIPSGKRFEVKKLVPADYLKLKKKILQRIGGEPLDYVLGSSEFCGEKIKVTPAVLCPRPETELLAERALKEIEGKETKVLDLCCGSGCIARVLSRSGASVTASDISDEALDVARENLQGSGAFIVKSDMLDDVEGEFDLIVSNPPYIKTADLDGLSEEVKKEPRAALDGGEDGLKFYRRISEGIAKGSLKKGGTLLTEIGYDIADGVREIFSPLFETVTIENDYAGLGRIAVCLGFKGRDSEKEQ